MAKSIEISRAMCLALALALPGGAAGQEEVAETETIPGPCIPEAAPEEGQEPFQDPVKEPPGTPCEPPTEEQAEQVRQEMLTGIAENTTTDALTLRSLLLGRDYVIFGRAEAEYAAYGGDIPSGENGGEMRRLRIGIAGLGTFSDRVSYKAEMDLTDGTNNLSDLYFQWDFQKWGSVRIGNQRVSQNLSAMTGTLSLLFMERPLPVSTFSLARRLAISHDINRGRWGLHGMLFTRDPNNNAGKYGYALRIITVPVRGPGRIGHLGMSLVTEKMDRAARYRTLPESNVTNMRLVDTGEFNDVNYRHTVGLELAGGIGSWSSRMEIFGSRWDREGGHNNLFKGAYIEFGNFLTGQEFNFVNGKFVRPTLQADEHAWEVGFRASWVSLTDGIVRGGDQLNVGAALNYYWRPGWRFMLNLLHYRTDSVANDDQGWILQTRVQYNR